MAIVVALAVASAILLVQVEAQLYLLAGSLAALSLAALHGSITYTKNQTQIRAPTGIAAGLSLVFISSCLTLTLVSTMPMVSWWFAWIIASQPLAYLVWRLNSNQHSWARLHTYIASIIGLTAIWAMAEFFYTGWRVNGPFKDFNAFGALMYLMLVPAAALFAGNTLQSPRRNAGLAGLIALGFLALFATQSRAATAVGLVAVAAVLIHARRSGAAITRAALTIGAIASASYLIIKLYPSHVDFRTLALGSDPSTLYRLMMWKSAWTAYLDYPLTGTGLGTYRLHYLHYRSPEELGTTGDLAHNDYLQMLMEGGPLLLALLLAWGGFALWLAWKLWKQAPVAAAEPTRRAELVMGFALAISVLGLFAHALVNFIFYVLPLSLLAGLYLAQAHRTIGTPADRIIHLPVGRGVFNFAAGTAATLVVGSLLVDWAGAAAFDTQVNWKPLVEMRASPQRRFDVASAFVAVRPDHVPARQAATTAAMDLALKERDSPIGTMWSHLALEQGKAWLAASQGNPYVYLTMGQLLWHFPALAGDMGPELPSNPEALLSKAIERYPAYPDSYRVLAQFYLAQNQQESALITLWHALRWIRIAVASEAILISWSQLIDEGTALAGQLKPQDLSPESRAAVDEFLSIRPMGAHRTAVTVTPYQLH